MNLSNQNQKLLKLLDQINSEEKNGAVLKVNLPSDKLICNRSARAIYNEVCGIISARVPNKNS
jgi:hypothetical protein